MKNYNVPIIHVDSFSAGFLCAYKAIRLGRLDAPTTTYSPAIKDTACTPGFREMVDNEAAMFVTFSVKYLKGKHPELSDEKVVQLIGSSMKKISEYVERCKETVSNMLSEEQDDD